MRVTPPPHVLRQILAEASGVDAANFPLPLIGPQGEGAAAAAATATATAATTAAATTAAAATASPQAPDVLHDDCAAAGDPLQRLLAGEVGAREIGRTGAGGRGTGDEHGFVRYSARPLAAQHRGYGGMICGMRQRLA